MTTLGDPVPITDPFTNAFNAVYESIRNSPSVKGLVTNAKNIVSSLETQPVIDYRQAGDLPALLLFPDTSDGDNLYSSSTTADFEMILIFRLMTGDERIGEYLFPLRWAISRALISNGITQGNEDIVSYNMTNFVVTNRPNETYADSERGWIAELTMNINLCIDHTQIVE